MICTFYSYKGGVGRSMALANVADHLSRQGLRVLMIDFDLEAPGLEQFFYRADERAQRDAVRGQTGLLDLLLAYKESMSVAGGGETFRAVERFIAGIFPSRPGGGRLDLMPAGQRLSVEQLNRYAVALRGFDWQDFYFNWEGDLFFEWLRRELVPRRYDMVLIDSRTGVTEMGGICGYQLADTIVMMCGANHQNVDGTWSMLEDFRSQPVEDLRRGRALEIVVVPARVEQRDAELLAAFNERFDERFGPLRPARLAECGLALRDLTVPYDPYFAFEERVARDARERDAKGPLAAVFARLADVITLLAPPDTPAEGALARLARDAASRLGAAPAAPGAPARPAPAAVPAAEARYDETRRFADFDVLLSHAAGDADALRPLQALLARHEMRVAAEASAVAPGPDWQRRMGLLLGATRTLALCLGASPPAAGQRELLAMAQRAAPRPPGRALRVVTVLLPGHEGEASALGDGPVLDLRAGLDVAELMAALAPSAPTEGAAAAAVEQEERCPYVGMAPFAEHQADLFHGRDAELQQLLEAVQGHRQVLLAGPSGCGKTSLIQAGLLPALRHAHPDWLIVVVPDLEAAEGALGAAAAGRTVLLVIDAQAQPSAPVRGNAFVERIVADSGAARASHVLLSLRSDAAADWQARLAAKGQAATSVALKAPDGLALRALVERPASAAGLAFEPGLVDRLLSRSEHEPGALPFLQAALVRLWQQRRDGWLTNAAYDAFGGLRGLVAEAAQQLHDGLADDGRAAMRRLLLRLVQFGVGHARATPQRVARTELVGSDPALASMLAILVDARLLVLDADASGAQVELAHEALARDWPPLQVWLEKEREFLGWRGRLDGLMKDWREGREPLLRGAALAEAERLLTERRADLTPRELAFVEAGLAQRDAERHQAERSRTRRLRWLSFAASLFAMLTLVAALGWYETFARRRVLAEQRDALVVQQKALLRQLTDLEAERNRSDTQLLDAQQRLDALQATIEQALDTARRAGEERDLARMTVAELERAVKQTEQVVQQQQDYSRKRSIELTRQQEVLRDVLKSAPVKKY